MEGTYTRRMDDRHMRGHAHGMRTEEIYTEGTSTWRGHTHGRYTPWDIKCQPKTGDEEWSILIIDS